MRERSGFKIVFKRFLRGAVARTKGWLLGSLFCLLAITPSQCWADDHGDTPETATLLTEGQVSAGAFVAGNINPAGDLDYFAFVVASGHVGYLYIIETTIPPEDPFSDTFITLVDKDRITPIVSDDNGGEGNASLILWSPEEAGTYYVEVSQLLLEDVGLYSLSVFRAGIAPPDDHGDRPDTATLLVVNDLPTEGSMELSADVDYFRFVAQPNYFYDIETSSLTTGSDTVITLYDSDGQTELGTDDQGGREFNASRILWLAPPDVQAPSDVYWVRVVQFLEGKSGVGYSIAASSEGEPSPLPMDGSPMSGYLENPGDVDTYVFSATKDHTTRVSLATTNDINNFRLRLLDTDGVSLLVEQKNLEFEDLVYRHEKTGVFPLLVTEPFTGKAYTLSASREATFGNPDLNGDGKIDATDIMLMLNAYHQAEEP